MTTTMYSRRSLQRRCEEVRDETCYFGRLWQA